MQKGQPRGKVNGEKQTGKVGTRISKTYFLEMLQDDGLMSGFTMFSSLLSLLFLEAAFVLSVKSLMLCLLSSETKFGSCCEFIMLCLMTILQRNAVTNVFLR